MLVKSMFFLAVRTVILSLKGIRYLLHATASCVKQTKEAVNACLEYRIQMTTGNDFTGHDHDEGATPVSSEVGPGLPEPPNELLVLHASITLLRSNDPLRSYERGALNFGPPISSRRQSQGPRAGPKTETLGVAET